MYKFQQNCSWCWTKYNFDPSRFHHKSSTISVNVWQGGDSSNLRYISTAPTLGTFQQPQPWVHFNLGTFQQFYSTVPTLGTFQQSQPWVHFNSPNLWYISTVPTLGTFQQSQPWVHFNSPNLGYISTVPTLDTFYLGYISTVLFNSSNLRNISTVPTLDTF